MYQEKQGYLENLELMTVHHLEDLLTRQEQVLRNKNLVKCLPDKGEKTKAFAEVLRNLIREKQNLDDLSLAFKKKVVIHQTSEATAAEPAQVCLSADITDKIEDGKEGEETHSDENQMISDKNQVDSNATVAKVSKFKTSRLSEKSQIQKARIEDAAEKRNVISEIFSETRKLEKKGHFKENIPLKVSDVASILKPENIKKLKNNCATSSKTVDPNPDDCLHPPFANFKEAKALSIQESLELQKHLKSMHDSRLVENAAARLIERLQGQPLPNAETLSQIPSDASRPWLVPSADMAAQLVTPRIAALARRETANLVEGAFVEYREKRDVDDIDDALYEEVLRTDESELNND